MPHIHLTLETISVKEKQPYQIMEKQPAEYKAIKNSIKTNLPKEEKIKI